MQNKKTSVISFRATNEVREELEFRADKYGWTVSQYVEKLVTNDITNKINTAEDMASEILELIKENKIKSMTELTKWAIENGYFDELVLTSGLWKDLFDEINGRLSD